MKRTFGINDFIIYFAFALVFSCNAQANSELNTDLKHNMTACHGCSESYSQSAAKDAWEPGESGTIFVLNTQREHLKSIMYIMSGSKLTLPCESQKKSER
ncbi:hypothetical protein J8Z24_08995 [Pseudoalteromonas sp. SCSIO 43201]|uniref:hypothetical protein n=1 Tax=Pseudoalteromonas sp. SCSIO 43201 TaxID=2822842 RepID=UPI0020752962|nr:hypothetical protein [Pseudoalteromonas sp. SCSIO 43201]USD27130.1 hypothetical protein J8Z24_08995 [Pseudoalteromonas sp. SCSIO 43201]